MDIVVFNDDGISYVHVTLVFMMFIFNVCFILFLSKCLLGSLELAFVPHMILQG